jgi:tetratricopeptide (TPR) repeat protein
MREERAQPEPEAVELEEMPEDPDEAMAWLERLAARQGASLDELPSLDEVEEELETPAWIARELAELEARADEAEADSGEEPLAAEEEMEPVQLAPEPLPEPKEAETPTASGDEAIIDELAEELDDEDIEEALPDWLAIEGEEEDFEAWAEDAADLTHWLEAEEAATTTETPPATELAPGPQAALTSGPVSEEAMPPAVEDAAVTVPEAEVPSGMEADLSAFDASVVEEARSAMRAGDLAAAVEHYRALLESGDDVEALVVELEQKVGEKPSRGLCQLLGDAYMQSGRLQPALDSYRRALETL